MANVQQTHVSGWTGWVGFASVVMAVSGIVHIIYGLGGIFGQDWYLVSAGNDAYLLDVEAWGWSLLVGGFLLLMASALLMSGNMFGRVIGILIAAGSLVANLALLSVTPVWSILAIVVDVLIIYAIAAHGGEMKNHGDDTGTVAY